MYTEEMSAAGNTLKKLPSANKFLTKYGVILQLHSFRHTLHATDEKPSSLNNPVGSSLAGCSMDYVI